MDAGSEDAAVQDFLEILEEHRKNCERQGKYVEAEIAKNRLDELKLHEENRRREAMRSRQIAERLGVEEAHMLEFQQFNLVWDRKMAEYEAHAEELVEAMKERHAAELRDYQRKLLGKEIRPKFSKDLLNLRKIQETLAKQKE
jgi:cobalamin biosynthesis Mg chelatase CobN